MIFWEPILWSTIFFFSNSLSALAFYLVFGCILGYLLFFLGIIGLIIRQISLIYLLLSIELIFFGMNLNFLFLGYLLLFPYFQIIVLILLTLTAAETAIFLAIIFLYHQQFKTTDIKLLQILKY